MTTQVIGFGTVTPGSGKFAAGERVTLTADPGSATSARFDHWGGNASGTSPTISITMNSNKKIIAYFENIQYRLNTNIQGNGLLFVYRENDAPVPSGSLVQGNGLVNGGDWIKIVAIADHGWIIDSWQGGSVITSGAFIDNEGRYGLNIEFRMESNRSFTFIFRKK